MNIVLIGPPACGKGTQAKFLCEKFNLYHFSTGDLFREIGSQNTDLANEIKSYIDKGRFVPDELTLQLVREKLKEIDSQQGILFDGFPRTVFQAEMLEKMLNIDFIVEISVSKDTIKKRVTDRGVCEACKKSFLLSQTNSNTCDECGGRIIRRADDTEQIAEIRFDDYVAKTFPIISYYKNHEGFFTVDGEKSISEVTEQICKKVRREI